MGNITKINFTPDQDCIWGIKGLEQWDKCQKLEISGLDISDEIVEVHFSLDEFQGTAKRLLGVVKDGVIHADIPAFIMEGPEHIYGNSDVYNAYAWVYVSDEESAETIRKMEFEIKSRPRPEEYVSPDEQDAFLKEIKQVMDETKEIAQSVRDDADAGKFDGEKGDKGDPGAIRKVIVPNLPTEDIDEEAVYLVKTATEGENKYIEYQYIEGEWEIIGASTYNVDLSEYVKITDYATSDKCGVVKGSNHVYVGTEGALLIQGASKELMRLLKVDGTVGSTLPLCVDLVDHIVLSGLTDCRINEKWGSDEKLLARRLLGIPISVGTGEKASMVGDGTIANGENQFVAGAYNSIDNNNQYAMIVGVGTESGRKSGFTIDWKGNAWVRESLALRNGGIEFRNNADISMKKGGGIVMKSPSGNLFRITVDDDGNLTTEAV